MQKITAVSGILITLFVTTSNATAVDSPQWWCQIAFQNAKEDAQSGFLQNSTKKLDLCEQLRYHSGECLESSTLAAREKIGSVL